MQRTQVVCINGTLKSCGCRLGFVSRLGTNSGYSNEVSIGANCKKDFMSVLIDSKIHCALWWDSVPKKTKEDFC